MRYLHWLVLPSIFLILLAAASCAGNRSGTDGPEPPDSAINTPVQAGTLTQVLPVLPVARQFQWVLPERQLEGSAVYAANPESEIGAHSINLIPNEHGIAYAIYEIAPDSEWIDSIIPILAADPPDSCYYLLSNYDRGDWEVIKPTLSYSPVEENFGGKLRVMVEDWQPYISDGDATYFCLLQYNAAPAERVTIDYAAWITPQERSREILNDYMWIESVLFDTLDEYETVMEDMLLGEWENLPERPDLLRDFTYDGPYFYNVVNADGDSYIGLVAYTRPDGQTGLWRRTVDGTVEYVTTSYPAADCLMIEWLREVHRVELLCHAQVGCYLDLFDLGSSYFLNERISELGSTGMISAFEYLSVVVPSPDDFVATAWNQNSTYGYTIGPDGVIQEVALGS